MEMDKLSTARQLQREREAVVRLYAKLGVLAEIWLATWNCKTASRQRWLRVLYEDVLDAAYEVALVFRYEEPVLDGGAAVSHDPWVLWERLLGYDWPNTAEEFAEGMRDLVALGRVLGVHEAAA
ncbi:hypothetical protein SAMN05421543_10918 [Alicyclobacillus macrosporangiidus]|uniref:Uncharacterized protein n=1 Tax=Alicyclobacillus macrosporangiidus TaxID=392015 RepID=A0A1I7J9B1_9BACL|nr:hypothetical protein SAMN05421543_10918 [Alicyclobacillus macrosporangiidus]